MFYKLRLRDYAAFLVIVVIGYLFTITQHFYVPAVVRPLTLLGILVLLLTMFFFWVKPQSAVALAIWLSVLMAGIALALVVIVHVVIHFDAPRIMSKLLVILAICSMSPFGAAGVYAAGRQRQKAKRE